MKEDAKRIDKPWGHEIWWARTERYVGKLLHIKAGESLSLQYHNVKDETIMVQSGTLLFETGSKDDPSTLKKAEMTPGDIFHIVPGTVHRMTGVTDVDLVEVSTPELDDVVRLEDRYGRAGTNKP
ncbi:MAG: cupin domain-containing protein [Vicinamibacteria bacterium]|nr:cupin domain-containing protein [Vicinamibacteria bacterium]